MARVHKWYFLVNEAGEPIENANVYITLAGTGGKESGVAAWIYYDEFGSVGTREMPQVTTVENGYFEFWIDEDEDFDVCNLQEIDYEEATSYGFNQKFRIDWEKVGVYNGYIDYIDVFPANRYFKPIDLSTCDLDNPENDSTDMNRTISQALACKWNTHVDFDIREPGADPTDAHGLELVRVTEQDTLANKIINNYYGWLWTRHEESTVETGLSGDAYGIGYFPHNLNPYTPGSYDEEWNVIVNDWTITTITDRLGEIKFGVYTVDVAGAGADAEWGLNPDSLYEATIIHNLVLEYPHVTIYDVTDPNNKVMVKTAEVQMVDDVSIKIIIAHEPRKFTVRIGV